MGVGIAVTRTLLRYRVAKLKAMGCNAYRCAHNCPSRELLEICDDLGMMVMAENRHYRSSEEVMRQLDELTLLDTRAVTAAMNGGVLTRRNASDVLDAAGMNYFIDDHMTYARRRPGHPMVGTENGPLYATRGIYKDDPKAQVYDSYGLTTAPFGQRLQETMEALEAAPHVAGLFVWGGFDYRGEPQPFEWPSVFSHWGLMDNCGFEKDTFYMLKSYYSDPNQRMVHLLPHWNWSEGERVRVCAMTNCDSAKLFLNGREVGVWRRRNAGRRGSHCRPRRCAGGCGCGVRRGIRFLDHQCSPDGQKQRARSGTRCGQARAFRGEARRDHRRGQRRSERHSAQHHRQILTFCGRCQLIVRPDAESRVDLTVCAEGLPEVAYRR